MSDIKQNEFKVFSNEFTDFFGNFSSFLNNLVALNFNATKLDAIEKDIINGLIDSLKKAINDKEK